MLEGEGFSLQPVAGNTYHLAVEWTDDSGVKDNTIAFANGNTQTSPGGKTTVSNMVYKTDKDTFVISAQDNQ